MGAVKTRTFDDFDDFCSAMLDFSQQFPGIDYAPNLLSMILRSSPQTREEDARLRKKNMKQAKYIVINERNQQK